MAVSCLTKPLSLKPFPQFSGWIKALGPGIIWMALAQGSGELIWWPYIVAKYGLGFLFLLIPACLLQFPLNYEIGRYTVLTGETIWQGFILLNRFFAFFLWLGVKIAKSSNNKFAQLTALGITFWISIQAFLNITANLGLAPLAGIPLPFFSYGGSHLVTELIGVGILLNISKNN